MWDTDSVINLFKNIVSILKNKTSALNSQRKQIQGLKKTDRLKPFRE